MGILSNNPSDFRVGDVVKDRHSGERGIVYRVITAAPLSVPVALVVWMIKSGEYKNIQTNLVEIVARSKQSVLGKLQAGEKNPVPTSDATVTIETQVTKQPSPSSSPKASRLDPPKPAVRPKRPGKPIPSLDVEENKIAALLSEHTDIVKEAQRRLQELPEYDTVRDQLQQVSGIGTPIGRAAAIENLERLGIPRDSNVARFYATSSLTPEEYIREKLGLSEGQNYNIVKKANVARSSEPLEITQHELDNLRNQHRRSVRNAQQALADLDSGSRWGHSYIDPRQDPAILRRRLNELANETPEDFIRRRLGLSSEQGYKIVQIKTRTNLTTTSKSRYLYQGLFENDTVSFINGDPIKKLIDLGYTELKPEGTDQRLLAEASKEIRHELSGRPSMPISSLENLLLGRYSLDAEEDIYNVDRAINREIDLLYWARRRAKRLRGLDYTINSYRKLLSTHRYVDSGQMIESMAAYANEFEGNNKLVRLLRGLVNARYKGRDKDIARFRLAVHAGLRSELPENLRDLSNSEIEKILAITDSISSANVRNFINATKGDVPNVAQAIALLPEPLRDISEQTAVKAAGFLESQRSVKILRAIHNFETVAAGANTTTEIKETAIHSIGEVLADKLEGQLQDLLTTVEKLENQNYKLNIEGELEDVVGEIRIQDPGQSALVFDTEEMRAQTSTIPEYNIDVADTPDYIEYAKSRQGLPEQLDAATEEAIAAKLRAQPGPVVFSEFGNIAVTATPKEAVPIPHTEDSALGAIEDAASRIDNAADVLATSGRQAEVKPVTISPSEISSIRLHFTDPEKIVQKPPRQTVGATPNAMPIISGRPVFRGHPEHKISSTINELRPHIETIVRAHLKDTRMQNDIEDIVQTVTLAIAEDLSKGTGARYLDLGQYKKDLLENKITVGNSNKTLAGVINENIRVFRLAQTSDIPLSEISKDIVDPNATVSAETAATVSSQNGQIIENISPYRLKDVNELKYVGERSRNDLTKDIRWLKANKKKFWGREFAETLDRVTTAASEAFSMQQSAIRQIISESSLDETLNIKKISKNKLKEVEQRAVAQLSNSTSGAPTRKVLDEILDQARKDDLTLRQYIDLIHSRVATPSHMDMIQIARLSARRRELIGRSVNRVSQKTLRRVEAEVALELKGKLGAASEEVALPILKVLMESHYRAIAMEENLTVAEYSDFLRNQVRPEVAQNAGIELDRASGTLKFSLQGDNNTDIINALHEILNKENTEISKVTLIDKQGREYTLGGRLSEISPLGEKLPTDPITAKTASGVHVAIHPTEPSAVIPLKQLTSPIDVSSGPMGINAKVEELADKRLRAVAIGTEPGAFVGLPKGQNIETVKNLLDPNRVIVGLDIETFGSTPEKRQSKIFDELRSVAVVTKGGKIDTSMELISDAWVNAVQPTNAPESKTIGQIILQTHSQIKQAEIDAGKRGITIVTANHNFDLGFLYTRSRQLAESLRRKTNLTDEEKVLLETLDAIANDFLRWSKENQADILLLRQYTRPRVIHSLEGTSIDVGVKKLVDTREHEALQDVQQMLQTYDVVRGQALEVLEQSTQPETSTLFARGRYYMLPQTARGTGARFGVAGSAVSNRILEFHSFIEQEAAEGLASRVGMRVKDIFNDEIIEITPNSPAEFGILLSALQEIPEEQVQQRRQEIVEDLANRRLRRLLSGERVGKSNFEYQSFDIRYHAATYDVGNREAPEQYIHEVLNLLNEHPVPDETNEELKRALDRLGITREEFEEMSANRQEVMERYARQLNWAKHYGSDVRTQEQFAAMSEFYGGDWQAHRKFFEELEKRGLTPEEKQRIIQERYQALFGEGGVLARESTVPIANPTGGYTIRIPGYANPRKVYTDTTALTELDLINYIDTFVKRASGTTGKYNEVIKSVIGEGAEGLFKDLEDDLGRKVVDEDNQIIRVLISEKRTSTIREFVSKAVQNNLEIQAPGAEGGRVNITSAIAEALGLDPQEVVKRVQSSDDPLGVFAAIVKSTIDQNEQLQERLGAGTTEAEWLLRNRIVPTEQTPEIATQVSNIDRNILFHTVPETIYPRPVFSDIDLASIYKSPYGYSKDFTIIGKTPQQVLEEYGGRGRAVLTKMLAHHDTAKRGIHTGLDEIAVSDTIASEISQALGYSRIDSNGNVVNLLQDVAQEVSPGNLRGAGDIVIAARDLDVRAQRLAEIREAIKAARQRGESITELVEQAKTVDDFVETTIGGLIRKHKNRQAVLRAIGYEMHVPREVLDVINSYYAVTPRAPIKPLKSSDILEQSIDNVAEAVTQVVSSGGPTESAALGAVKAAEQGVVNAGSKGPTAAAIALAEAIAGGADTPAERLGQVISSKLPGSYQDFKTKLQRVFSDSGNKVIAGVGAIALIGLATHEIKQRNPYDIEYSDEIQMENNGTITNKIENKSSENIVITGKIRAKTKSDIDQATITNAVHSAITGVSTAEPEKSHNISDHREKITPSFVSNMLSRLFHG